MDPMNQGQSVGSYVAGEGGPLTASAAPTADEKTMGLLAHIGPLIVAAVTAGALGWLVPLFLMMTKGKESGYIRYHAVESLNFQITLAIAALGTAVLSLLCIGVFLIPVVALAGLILPILAGLKAHEGVMYRYPVTLRLVK